MLDRNEVLPLFELKNKEVIGDSESVAPTDGNLPLGKEPDYRQQQSNRDIALYDAINTNKKARFDFSSFQRYCAEVGRPPILSREEELALVKAAKLGKTEERGKAAKELIGHNLVTVIGLALSHQGFGVDLSDLVQVGNLGLHKALETYDLSKRAKKTGLQIKYSNHARRRAWAEMQLAIRRQDKLKTTLDAPIDKNDPDSTTKSELLTYPEQIMPFDRLLRQDKSDLIYSALKMLPKKFQKPHFRRAMELKFGFHDRPPMTDDEIGKQMGCTGSNVQQYLASLLPALGKQIRYLEKLRDYRETTAGNSQPQNLKSPISYQL